MIIDRLEQKMKERDVVADLAIDVINLITIVNRIEEKNLNQPFSSFKLMFIDSGGTHIIRYSDNFEESKSAVIHQLNKILKYPQNYLDVNVFINTVEEPENKRTLYIKFFQSAV